MGHPESRIASLLPNLLAAVARNMARARFQEDAHIRARPRDVPGTDNQHATQLSPFGDAQERVLGAKLFNCI